MTRTCSAPRSGPAGPAALSRIPVDSTGMRRRLRAMVADGYPQQFLRGVLDLGVNELALLLWSDNWVDPGTAWKVQLLHEDLRDRDPGNFGVSKITSSASRARARRNGWAPSAAWDERTIDDPAASPHP